MSEGNSCTPRLCLYLRQPLEHVRTCIYVNCYTTTQTRRFIRELLRYDSTRVNIRAAKCWNHCSNCVTIKNSSFILTPRLSKCVFSKVFSDVCRHFSKKMLQIVVVCKDVGRIYNAFANSRDLMYDSPLPLNLLNFRFLEFSLFKPRI